jgi:uncharacterized protein
MNAPVRSSNPAELQALDRVCERLGGFVDDLDAERVDGFLTALAAGPRVPDDGVWLEALTGDAFDRVFADPPDRQQALRALRARLAVLRGQLDPDAMYDRPDMLRLDPLLLEWTDEARAQAESLAAAPLPAATRDLLHTGAAWADAFLQAVQRLETVWALPESGPDAEALDFYADCLARIQLLCLPPDGEAFAAQHARLHGEQSLSRDDLIDDACFAVQDLRLWWVDQLPRPQTRVVGPQPGRNDPCPCGSGRKYKKCHGA